MITTYPLTGCNPQPYDPERKLYVGPTDWRDPDGRACVASWQAHVDAGRFCRPPAALLQASLGPTAVLLEASLRPTAALPEASLGPTAALLEASSGPTASLLKAGAGLSDETREAILANERLICGRQRTFVD